MLLHCNWFYLLLRYLQSKAGNSNTDVIEETLRLEEALAVQSSSVSQLTDILAKAIPSADDVSLLLPIAQVCSCPG